jgi:predicted nucleotidyltransferase
VTPRFARTLKTLAEAQVDFVVVGGIAAVLQGAPIVTFDLDLVHRRTPDNVARLLAVLEALHARYRDPRNLKPAASTLLGPGHHLLATDHGPLDLLGAIADGLTYDDLAADTVSLDVEGHTVPVLGLPRLIAVKQAAGRPKDLAVLPTLRATLTEQRRPS